MAANRQQLDCLKYALKNGCPGEDLPSVCFCLHEHEKIAADTLIF
jgi:hypothetical protein